MKKSIGIYEAKTKLSSLLKSVKEKKITIQISDRGKPIAQLCPIPERISLDDHLANLVRSGVITLAESKGSINVIAKSKGALNRFLSDRD